MARAGFFGRHIVARGLSSVGAVLLLVAANAPSAFAQADHMQWDIVSLSASLVISAGSASAHAADGSTITLTGSGMFVAPAGGGGTSSAATGGGTWTVCNAGGTICTSGGYAVTGLVRWEPAPGTLPSAVTDTIDNGQPSSGLVALRVEYSDGERGVLFVSCHLPVGAPATIFEGITASKGFVDYWNRVPPTALGGNRTLFHIE